MNSVVRHYTRWVLAALVATGLLLPPGPAGAAGPEKTGAAGARTGGKIAVVLVISGQPLGVIQIPLSRIRAVGSHYLTAALSEQGFTVIPPGKMLSLMREWRVRDGKSIPRGFLDNIAEVQEAGLLLVANLVVQPGRLIVTGRYLDPGSARLLKVSMAEWVIGRDPGQAPAEEGSDWLIGIQETCKMIGQASPDTPGPGREPMLILAAQTVGCSESTALIATHALLGYFAEYGRWDLIDPAVTASTLQDAGHSGKYLGAEARALLQDTYACSGLLIPGLISYDPVLKSNRRLDEIGDDSSQGALLLTDFALSLRLIDLNSGAITAGREVFMEVLENTGWFGVPRKDTLMTRLQTSAGRLWSDLLSELEEF